MWGGMEGGEEGVQVNRARIPCYANLLHGSFPGFRFRPDEPGSRLISDGTGLDGGLGYLWVRVSCLGLVCFRLRTAAWQVPW